MIDPRLVFVLSPFQNAFFRELAEVLIDELTRSGVRAIEITEPGDHAVEDDDVFVLMPPHEFVALEGRAFVDDPRVAARTIGICAEQPHQVFFEANGDLGAQLGGLMDFSEYTVKAFRARGLDARHLRFGYTPSWDRFDPERLPAGDPPVLYMGNKRPRRLQILAGAADALAAHDAMLLVSDNITPNLTTTKTFRAGEDKRRLLSRTRLLVNIHQSDEPYFEWLRVCEAAHCGTPVLSETSMHSAPFVAGHHFLAFDPAHLAGMIDASIADDEVLQDVRSAAYATLREHPLSESIAVLLEMAGRLRAQPAPSTLPSRTRTEPTVVRPPVTPSLPAPELTAAVGGSGFAAMPGISRLPWKRTATPTEPVLIAPRGTEPILAGFERLARLVRDGRPAATGVLVGAGLDGLPTLEGIWPWETFRLLLGQHLGRLMVVHPDVARAAAAWAPASLRRHPHLAVQAFMAATGLEGAHVPTPVARVRGEHLDPTHTMPEPLAAAVRRACQTG